jgi:hypothetical protein
MLTTLSTQLRTSAFSTYTIAMLRWESGEKFNHHGYLMGIENQPLAWHVYATVEAALSSGVTAVSVASYPDLQ